MNQERRDEIHREFVRGNDVTREGCEALEIQELIYCAHSAIARVGQETAEQEELEARIKLLLATLYDKIRNAEELYIAYHSKAPFPHLDQDQRIWMFSKEEYARQTEEYFLQQFLQLRMKKLSGEEIRKEFAEMHRLGFTKILLDNGQHFIEVERDQILPPDWSDTPEINRPISNPEVLYAMIRFFQNLGAGGKAEGGEPSLYELEGLMLDAVTKGKYLVPMKIVEQEPSPTDEQGMRTLKQGTTLQFASLVKEDRTTWLPVFTDWVEFEKTYDKTEWGGNVASYEDILALSETLDGVVINPNGGIPFPIAGKNKQKIEEHRNPQTPSQSNSSSEPSASSKKNLFQAVMHSIKKWFNRS